MVIFLFKNSQRFFKNLEEIFIKSFRFLETGKNARYYEKLVKIL